MTLYQGLLSQGSARNAGKQASKFEYLMQTQSYSTMKTVLVSAGLQQRRNERLLNAQREIQTCNEMR